MTIDTCKIHATIYCHCPRSAYSDPRTGQAVNVITELPAVPATRKA